MLPDDKIGEGVNSLNSKQREVINLVFTWAKHYVKQTINDIEPAHMFL